MIRKHTEEVQNDDERQRSHNKYLKRNWYIICHTFCHKCHTPLITYRHAHADAQADAELGLRLVRIHVVVDAGHHDEVRLVKAIGVHPVGVLVPATAAVQVVWIVRVGGGDRRHSGTQVDGEIKGSVVHC